MNAHRFVNVKISLPAPEEKCWEVSCVYGKELVAGDFVLISGEFHEVTQTYLHPRSCYNKIHTVADSDREYYKQHSIIGCYRKIPLSQVVYIKKRSKVVSGYLIEAGDSAKRVLQLVGDYAAVKDLPARVEVAPSVWMDKEVIVKTARSEMKAECNRLSELMKKL